MNKSGLVENLKLNNISFNDEQIEKLIHLMKYTLDANQKFNLTAIKYEETFLEKMIFDSAVVLKYIDLKDKKCIDVGTGAGFPGLVLSILNDDANFTLLDSTSKKIEHIKNFINLNNLNASGVSARAEDYSRKNIEKYDYAFARAVASLNVLLEIISPMVKVGGYFVALKGPGVEEEIKLSNKAFKILNLEICDCFNLKLPECLEERNILIIKKIGHTPDKYPREYGTIKKRPL